LTDWTCLAHHLPCGRRLENARLGQVRQCTRKWGTEDVSCVKQPPPPPQQQPEPGPAAADHAADHAADDDGLVIESEHEAQRGLECEVAWQVGERFRWPVCGGG
jgi:hypothetical protein